MFDKKLSVLNAALKNEIYIKNIKIGAGGFALIAGPCAVESHEQLYNSLFSAKKSGANIIRAGAYKLRTSPYTFKGLGDEGLGMLISLGKELEMPVVSEIPSSEYIERFSDIDIIQIGARNMQNIPLLKTVADTGKPVLLKRGFSATIEEFLLSAEYLITSGTNDIILCERGIRTFEPATRNTLDLSAVPLLKSLTNLPVIVDPSHGTGLSELVIPMSKAAVASGCDGLMIEIHPNPKEALSDSRQSISLTEFDLLSSSILKYLQIENKIIYR